MAISPERPPAARVRLDRARRRRDRHPHGPDRRRSPPATRRTRTTSRATAAKIFHASIGPSTRAPTTRRRGRDEGRARLRDRRRPHAEGARADRHGRKLARRPSAGMSSACGRWRSRQRALRLLPALVPPRLRRVRPSATTASSRSRSYRSAPRGGTARTEYLLDSAHHGLAMNQAAPSSAWPARCPTTRRSSTAAAPPAAHRAVGRPPTGPPRATTGAYCFVSVAGEDRVAVISFRRQGGRQHQGRRPPPADAAGYRPPRSS